MKIDISQKESEGWFLVPTLKVNGTQCKEMRTSRVALHGWWGELHFTGKAVSPIFVGSGELEHDVNGGMFYRFARRRFPDGDRLYVPGSSIKGVLRTITEALSPSCFADVRSCSCPACRMFGSFGLGGNISMDDACFRNSECEISSILQRRSPSPIGVQTHRKFYTRVFDPPTSKQMAYERIETVNNAQFDVRVSIQRLTDWELGLLLLATGTTPNHTFCFKMGGGKSRNLGLIRLTWHDGAVGTASEWFRGERPSVDTAAKGRWLGALRQKATNSWAGLWPDMLDLVAFFQQEYGE